MFLYKKNDQNVVSVYRVVPKLEEIAEYKKNEMKQIADEEKFWQAAAGGINPEFEFKTTGEKLYLQTRDCYKYASYCYGYYNRLERVCLSSERANFFLERYYSEIIGYLSKVREAHYHEYTNQHIAGRYFLAVGSGYSSYNSEGLKMDGIISVPKSLYILNLFLRCDFEKLEEFDYSELLKFFSIEFVSEVDLNELKKAYETQLILASAENIDKTVSHGQKVFQKLEAFQG